MTDQRPLRPDEIELLLDGEDGFGMAELRAKLRRSPDAQAELRRSRLVVDSLESLPHFSPSPLFADRVMAQVQVFEPWHVAALDSARRFVPQSRPARVMAGALGAASAAVFVGGGFWLLERADIAMLMTQLGFDQFRAAVLTAGADAQQQLLGARGVDLVRTGGLATWAGLLAGFAAVAGVGVTALRRLSIAAGRRG
jgi:hypothetical protein